MNDHVRSRRAHFSSLKHQQHEQERRSVRRFAASLGLDPNNIDPDEYWKRSRDLMKEYTR